MNVPNIVLFFLIGSAIFIVAMLLHGFWVAYRKRAEPIRLDIADLETAGGKTADFSGEKTTETEAVERDYRKRSIVVIAGTATAAVSIVLMFLELSVFDLSVKQQILTMSVVSGAICGSWLTIETHEFSLESTDDAAGEVSFTPTDIEAVSPKESGRRNVLKEATQIAPGQQRRAFSNQPMEVIVLNVEAKPGNLFVGSNLVSILRQLGLRFGEMFIFHHIEARTKKTLFSVANMVEPGTFDLSDLNGFQTPGLIFFLPLSEESTTPLDSLELMLKSAKSVATSLSGELTDEKRRPFTSKSEALLMEKVRSFQSYSLAAKSGRA